MSTVITKEAWLQAVEQAMSRRESDEGMTSHELADVMGIGIKRLCAYLSALQRAGRLVVGRSMRTTIDGRTQPVPVYRLKP